MAVLFALLSGGIAGKVPADDRMMFGESTSAPIELGKVQRSTQEKLLFGMSTALIAVDWLQTLQVANNPGRWAETNPILPRHPSRGDVNRHFLIAAGAHLYLSTQPKPFIRKTWLWSVTAFEGMAVGNNFGLGLNVKF